MRLAVDAGSEVVEWAGDRHVRPGDRTAASAARGACAGAGLRIGTYGSYHKAGADDPAAFAAVVATAAELGAPRVRVWAGTAASADVSPAERAATVDALRRCADAVAEQGLGLLVEHHVESLTDGLDTASALRTEVDHPALVTHWQPRELPDTDACLTEVRVLRPRTVHAFSWGADGFTERLPLADRADLWAPVLAELAAQSAADDADVEVLLEFVPGDTAASLRRDAAALRDLRSGRDLAGAR
ncbi:sugar phosphate isomerase/epimerase [Pseudonocardia sp. ICBG1293]|uniref:sugar phosphate isomerase/epimerase family protein n=1 Tax=Pseudonocardia sp. ICBG1293 TaxID=2844382 RepID=UPI001CCF8513|nr:TIM barrel protein [Pseudonocardia sp. ICBG1293]